ncbi:cation diffusion facilitator family transporter [Bacillus sp. 165]|uniref:cation diffusion facilitator family transporter n=1 Tax=Bacillus sp. 165 TaxID=1529117 RepID=UPI001AD9920D|nr:cation diffusion facilitator family transporter [Bacillus sp. 165]MBO9129294.1 cation transporter [Bacillus sp. 165]
MEQIKQYEADRGAIVSIIAYIILSAAKIIVSMYTDSSALQADGLNNLTDIGASAAVLIGLKISRKPRDHDHPYGHSRAEQISSLVASFIMMSVGLQVMLSGISSVFSNEQDVPNVLAAWIAGISAIIMLGVFMYNNNLAQRTHSKALEAAAKDNLSDALVSIGTVIGVLGSQFNLPLLDKITAVIVGGIICKTAWDIFKEASHMLTDGYDPHKIEKYKETIESISGVEALIDLKARKYGNATYVDIIIEVDAGMDVERSHQITDDIEEQLRARHFIYNSHIHVEPNKK